MHHIAKPILIYHTVMPIHMYHVHHLIIMHSLEVWGILTLLKKRYKIEICLWIRSFPNDFPDKLLPKLCIEHTKKASNFGTHWILGECSLHFDITKYILSYWHMNQKFMVTGMDSVYSEILAYPFLTLGDHQKMLMPLFF